MSLASISSPPTCSTLIVAFPELFALFAGMSLSVPSASSLNSSVSLADSFILFAYSLGIDTVWVNFPTFWTRLSSSTNILTSHYLIYYTLKRACLSHVLGKSQYEEERLLLDDRRGPGERGRHVRQRIRPGSRSRRPFRVREARILF